MVCLDLFCCQNCAFVKEKRTTVLSQVLHKNDLYSPFCFFKISPYITFIIIKSSRSRVDNFFFALHQKKVFIAESPNIPFQWHLKFFWVCFCFESCQRFSVNINKFQIFILYSAWFCVSPTIMNGTPSISLVLFH